MAYIGGLFLGCYERNSYLCGWIGGSNYPPTKESRSPFHPHFDRVYKYKREMREIKLTQGKVALVDDEDYDFLMQWKWFAAQCRDGEWYARRRTSVKEGRKLIPMHRQIMNPPANLVIDHIDHNTLNNQKDNLRICTDRQNRQNSLKRKNCINPYKGVVRRRKKPHNRWRYRAYICVNGVHIRIGSYDTAEEAARVYDEAAKKYFGEYANLNFK